MKSSVPIQHLHKWMVKFSQSVVVSENIRIQLSSFNGYGIKVRPDCNVRRDTKLLTIRPKAWLPYSADSAVEVMRVKDAEFLNRIIDMSTRLLPHYAAQRKSLVESVCMAFNLIAPLLFQPTAKSDDSIDGYVRFLATSGYPFCPGSLPHPIEGPRSLAHGEVFNSRFGPSSLQISTEIDAACLLAGSQVFVDMEKRRLMHDSIARQLLGADERSASARRLFLWGMGKILSRALSNTHMVNTDGTSNSLREPSPFSMVPVLDLVNHGNSAAAVNAHHVFDCASNSFQLIAERDIHGGEEVLISYGSQRSTSSFVNIYGFAGRSTESKTSSNERQDALEMDSIYLNNPGDSLVLSFPLMPERLKSVSSPLTFPAVATVSKGGTDHRLKIGLPLCDIFDSGVQATEADFKQFAAAMKSNPLSIPDHVLSGLTAFLSSESDSPGDHSRMRLAAVRLFITVYCSSDACEDVAQKLLNGVQGAIDAICYAGEKMQHFGFRASGAVVVHSQSGSQLENDFLQHLLGGINSFRREHSLVDEIVSSYSFNASDENVSGQSCIDHHHRPSHEIQQSSLSLKMWKWNTCAPVIATEFQCLLLLRDSIGILVRVSRSE